MQDIKTAVDGEDRYGKQLLGMIGLYLLLILMGCTFASLALAQTPDTSQAGMLYLQENDHSFRPALHLQTEVGMNIEGMVSRVTVKHTFVNDSNSWQEGVYVFPLPEDSAANRFRMLLSEREIIGEIHEREEAVRRYETAKSEGRKAALMEQHRPNMFTQRIANIAPGETLSIELAYVQAVRYDQGRFSLRFPMTITPRYMPAGNPGLTDESLTLTGGNSGWVLPQTSLPAPDTPYLPLHLENPITFDIQLKPGLAPGGITSRSHAIDSQQITNGTEHYRITLSEGQVNMNKDFQLEWWPQQGEAPLAAVFIEELKGESFVQLMLLPPLQLDETQRQPREISIILDTSGSMEGNSIRQAKQSVEYALSRLRPGDTFNLIEFNTSARALFAVPQPASSRNIASALSFVRRLNANGGTNIAAALHQVFNQTSASADDTDLHSPLQQIVFITDGSVGNEDQLFTLIREKLGAMRLFTVGIGSAPNSFFMRKAAEVGKGSYTYVSSVDEVTESMTALFNKIENPVVTGVRIDWPSQLAVEQYPATIPDLYLGEPVFVTARLDGDLDREAIQISGRSQGENWQRSLTGRAPADEMDAYVSSALASYWGRLKIESLLDSQQLGADRAAIKQAVLAVALPFQLMSPFTSFVAVENIISRPPEAGLTSSPVGNAAPEGQDLAARLAGQQLQPTQLSYAATASGLHWHLLLGMMALGMCTLLAGISGWRAAQ